MSAVTPVTQPVVLAPSKAHTWLVCRAAPGYVAALKAQGRLPAEEPADYTQEGIDAHRMGERALKHGEWPLSADMDMVVHVRGYVQFVQRQVSPGFTLLVERRVRTFYSKYMGTLDSVVIADDGSSIRLNDLKYGRGVSVQAHKNPQLTIYLKSLADELMDLFGFRPDTRVILTIWQPRVLGEKTERTYECTLQDIEDHCEWIGEVARDIQEHPLLQRFSPGDKQCQFCDAAAICEARTRDLIGGFEDTLTVVDVLGEKALERVAPPAPRTLTPAQLSRVLQLAPRLRSWLKEVEAHAFAVMEQGLEVVPNYKLVRGRAGNRKWRDEEAARAQLAALFPDPATYVHSKLATPAQAEVLIKDLGGLPEDWEAFNANITRAEGSLSLAPLDDEREAVDPRQVAHDEFHREPGEDLL